MRLELNGGKTAPRLLQDLMDYDPRWLPSTGFNILAQQPPQFEEGRPSSTLVTKNNCRHDWALKEERSDPPKQRKAPDSLSIYVIAAYCTECRSHLDLSLDFRGQGNGLVPCPNKKSPLHHFVYKPEISQRRRMVNGTSNFEKETGWVDMQRFQCSAVECSAKLCIRVKPPRLTEEWVSWLTDMSLINQRAMRVIAEDPERFEGHAPPQPTEVLSNLYKYIDDAMNGGMKRIPGHNKKWLLCLGEPCLDLLLYLGFTWDSPDWIPPRPEAAATTPFEDPFNILLSDVQKELLVLQSRRPETERRGGTATPGPISAMMALRSALGCLEYDTTLRSRTVDLSKEEHPFYAALGAIGDFHDDLVAFAYQRQIDTDSANTPYYLECLQAIGEGRKSEALETLAAIEASSGKISLKDVREAYKEFGLDFPSLFLEEDTIIGTFQSRVSDAPRQETELRTALKIIGQHRSSEKIQRVASNVVSNYEQAISWLSATEDMDDAFLVAMHCTKVHESPADVGLANQAVAIIAEHRNSNALKAWLATGVLGEIEMDISRAYNRLELTDRTIDDVTVLAAYNYHVSEAPSQREDLRSALISIAKSRGSTLLQDFLDSGMVSSEYPLSEWPVGLENIGNTCYLNSLLQFYFTVKPLRDLVLNFDEHKMDIEGDNLENKRVGSRRVSKKEVERAQRFVYELQKLFQNMISALNAQVTPEQELARLTLMSSITEEQIRRHSVRLGHRPSLGEIDGRPLLGPLPAAAENNDEMKKGGQNQTPQGLPSSNEAPSEIPGSIVASHAPLLPNALSSSIETVEAERKQDENTCNDDDSSDATLVVGEDVDQVMLDYDDKVQQQQIFEDKENLPPNKTDSVRSITPEPQLQPLGESSPSRINELPQLSTAAQETVQSQKDVTTIYNAEPPSRPPPFPPRPQPEEHPMADVEIGAQQDVTEVIANVLFQLQCAIKAESFDESGEQIDQIKNLFFAKQKSYTTNKQGLTRTKEDFISDIKIDVASGPRDIYAALDGAYDEQEVEYGGALDLQHTAITQLPPILQILVQRAQFDQEKKSSFKSNHHLELKETIYMDRYMDTVDEDLTQRRHECWAWKRDLALLQARKLNLTKTDSDVDLSEVLASTTDYLRQIAERTAQDEDPIELPESLLQGIETASNDVKRELESIDSRIKTLTTSIQSQFSDLRNIPYRLHSVFIHRGDVSSGHYWIYIHDFARKMWRKYNDGYVTEVKDTREIFDRDDDKRPATPYFMVYIKDDLKNKLVDPVCRNIFQVPRETQDVVMIDLENESDEQRGSIEVDPLANVSNSYGNGSSRDSSKYDQAQRPQSSWESGSVLPERNW